jgi:hypothetical protein
MLERDIEAKFSRLCKANGILTLKMQTQGSRGRSGYPDRLVFLGQGRHCWIEFKATGKTDELTDLQDLRIKTLRKMGEAVLVTDDASAAMAWVGELL